MAFSSETAAIGKKRIWGTPNGEERHRVVRNYNRAVVAVYCVLLNEIRRREDSGFWDASGFTATQLAGAIPLEVRLRGLSVFQLPVFLVAVTID